MVTRLILLVLLLPAYLCSGEFTATVNRNQINMGESITLNLTLKNASAQGSPSLGLLKNSFFINSQQQSSNTVVINGQVSSSTTWRIILTPQNEGDALIPPINIHTSAGTLSSNPIRIKVNKAGTAGPDSSAADAIILTSDISKTKPYKNEPVIFTVRIISKVDLTNVTIQKFSIEDAIVESEEEPKVYTKIIDGVRTNVIDFGYVITPLKSGSLKIPSILVQGGIPIKRKPRPGSFFDDDFEPFFLLTDRLKPFNMLTTELALDVQPAVAGMNPWLPAKSLKLEETWDPSQELKAGEPIIRGINIVAEGLVSSQLPDLSGRQFNEDGIKVYADKPVLKDEFKKGNIHSYRNEQYTLIPQQSGTLTLPEISVAWWNVAKNEKAVARLPARTIQILPAPESAKSAAPPPAAENVPAPTTQPATMQRDPILYAALGVLAVSLFAAVIWVIALQRKIGRMSERPVDLKQANNKQDSPRLRKSSDQSVKPLFFEKPGTEKKEKKEKKEKLPDLNPT